MSRHFLCIMSDLLELTDRLKIKEFGIIFGSSDGQSIVGYTDEKRLVVRPLSIEHILVTPQKYHSQEGYYSRSD